ncbi:fasciclin domain-containing protein [Methanohalophilus portucalensis]|uniref:Beta-Ig-H3/fasciclin n=2 Tax=Methanohalophilus portucalensis TaxID=39664 RepID=A0A1L9C6N3_9EURY|nr:fasciclin domain-containing protein [Methanohalophilus portucalensis]ATU08780.1 beta-Ig-H3/fasciclin [Methanohalophilus portucalensis]OJH50182.1 beta-Ig-H3/fasciclin [Methanohalophilus portucalensis FDF-1]RNI13042.1 fasciclin domain-containing protein [Methanohalophilus portucalensis FDF-1]SMH30801.1 Uncaracterized surface protein containing fasciclin (FAS1) repeats [Methanohalophilus portucalensis FDF-1]
MKIIKMMLALLVATSVFLAGCAEEPAQEEMDIVETAVDAGSFETLVLALQSSGLDETLSGEGPFTVFAPTDEAFEALPEGTLEDLLEDEEVLTYHVVAGEYMSSDITDMTSAETVQGEEIAIEVSDGSVMVNDASVIQADIETGNGVIHVIDKVIMPPSMKDSTQTTDMGMSGDY